MTAPISSATSNNAMNMYSMLMIMKHTASENFILSSCQYRDNPPISPSYTYISVCDGAIVQSLKV